MLKLLTSFGQPTGCLDSGVHSYNVPERHCRRFPTSPLFPVIPKSSFVSLAVHIMVFDQKLGGWEDL